MGFFSFLSRKKNKSHSSDSHSTDIAAGQTPKVPPAKKWQHKLESLLILTDPLDGAIGTSLEISFLYSTLTSIMKDISRTQSEEESLESQYFALNQELLAKAAAEEIVIDHFEIVGLTDEPRLGFSARMSASGKKYTVLYGDAPAVARASTPFHPHIASSISSFSEKLSNSAPSDSQSSISVLAIDGIAYAVVVTSSQLR